MSKKRYKISATYNDFIKKINGLQRFDSQNQTNFQKKTISKEQLGMLSESCFFSGFREYENFIRDIFLLYTQEKVRMNGQKVISYLNPKDFNHAERLIRSSLHFLDWNSPNIIIDRAELYLKNGFPIKDTYTLHKTQLNSYKAIRNHIAHNSAESLNKYMVVLRNYYGTNPLKPPSVGEYLQLTSKRNRTEYHLLEFFNFLKDLAKQVS